MSAIESIYLVFLGTGFTVGFGHCIGMCGPIVFTLSLQLKHRPSFFPHLFYNLGRTATYAILGAAAGWMGSFTRLASGLGGMQKWIMAFAGLVIALLGLGMTGWLPLGRIFSNAPSLSGLLGSAIRRLQRSKSALFFLPVGMALGLIPCGPVYTALLAAARRGMEAESALLGAASGSAIMAAFGLGTIPALLILSRVTSASWLRHREWIYRLGGLAMLATGIYFMVKGIRY